MKSNQTKAKEISYETKMRVLDRQGNRSITGVMLSPYTVDFHHVVKRSNAINGGGGVGYEWNIVAITRDEHRRYHDHANIQVNGRDRYTYSEFETLMKNHLKKHYVGWSEDKCKYKKGAEENDYGIIRRVWW